MNSLVYIQIHNQSKQDVEDGEWKVDNKIPAEHELANSFGISRMILRQAIQASVDEGIFERRVGSGTFVANRKAQERMLGITSFTELMHATGKKAASKTIPYHSMIPPQTGVEELRLVPDEQALRMKRVRCGNNVLICYGITTVSANLAQKFSEEEITASSYWTLEKKVDPYPGHAIQHISATRTAEKTAGCLQTKHRDTLLRMTQLSYLQDGRPPEYVHTQYARSQFEFVFEK